MTQRGIETGGKQIQMLNFLNPMELKCIPLHAVGEKEMAPKRIQTYINLNNCIFLKGFIVKGFEATVLCQEDDSRR